jgi:hypothetical protein
MIRHADALLPGFPHGDAGTYRRDSGSTFRIAAPAAPARRFGLYVSGGVTPVSSFQTFPIESTNFSRVTARPDRRNPSSRRIAPE